MQITTQYIPGRGYTVRDASGKVIAHSLNPSQLAALQAAQKAGNPVAADLLK